MCACFALTNTIAPPATTPPVPTRHVYDITVSDRCLIFNNTS
jgi:hypothetical protein